LNEQSSIVFFCLCLGIYKAISVTNCLVNTCAENARAVVAHRDNQSEYLSLGARSSEGVRHEAVFALRGDLVQQL